MTIPRLLITLSALAGLSLITTSCATAHRSTHSNPSSKRKAELQECVSNFLAQDVSPVDSLNICSSIYSRWEATTTRPFTSGDDLKRSAR